MECPSTPHRWSSLLRKWGRCTATAEHPWWCTAGEKGACILVDKPRTSWNNLCMYVRTCHTWYAFPGYSLYWSMSNCKIYTLKGLKFIHINPLLPKLPCMFEFCNCNTTSDCKNIRDASPLVLSHELLYTLPTCSSPHSVLCSQTATTPPCCKGA